MSDQMSFTLKYRSRFDADSLQKATQALSHAIADNWMNHAQPWGMEQMDLQKELKDFLQDGLPTQMTRWEPEDETDCELSSRDLSVLVSPTCSWLAHTHFYKSWEGLLGVSFRIDEDMRYLDYEFSGVLDTVALWNVNQKCLLHIVECMKGAMPVQDFDIGEQFYTEMS